MGSTVFVILGLVLAVLVLILCTVKFKIHPFFALIATTVTFAVVSGMNMEEMLGAFAEGMGGTVSDIGLVIALGTVTGALLEKSGAAETMAKTILNITGEKHAALGLTITGKKYYYLPKSMEAAEEEEMDRKRPNAVMSFLPILAPIALMLLKTIGEMVGWQGMLMNLVEILGTPAVALMVGLLIALMGYCQIFPEDKTAWGFDGVFADALKTAGQIVLIVGAGGGFSGVLKASALQNIITQSFSGLAIGILAPFIIGFIFRTSVGSATMITPLLDILGFASPMGRIIAMLACAAGGMMVFHGNDDFFWVTATTSEMDTAVAYKTIPVISILQSITALLIVFILSLVFLH